MSSWISANLIFSKSMGQNGPLEVHAEVTDLTDFWFGFFKKKSPLTWLPCKSHFFYFWKIGPIESYFVIAFFKSQVGEFLK